MVRFRASVVSGMHPQTLQLTDAECREPGVASLVSLAISGLEQCRVRAHFAQSLSYLYTDIGGRQEPVLVFHIMSTWRS